MSQYPDRTKRPLPMWIARRLVRFTSGSLQTVCADVNAWFEGEAVGEVRQALIKTILTHYTQLARYEVAVEGVVVVLRARWVDRAVANTYMLHVERQKDEAKLLRMFVDGPPPAPKDKGTPGGPPASQQYHVSHISGGGGGGGSASSIAAMMSARQQQLNEALATKLDMVSRLATPPVVSIEGVKQKLRDMGAPDDVIRQLVG